MVSAFTGRRHDSTNRWRRDTCLDFNLSWPVAFYITVVYNILTNWDRNVLVRGVGGYFIGRKDGGGKRENSRHFKWRALE